MPGFIGYQIKRSFVNRLSGNRKVGKYYLVKENILSLVIERYLPEFRCLPVMWSFHDDIRRNLREIMEELQTPGIDLKRFNRLAGDIFFNIYTIRFREERILFPVIRIFPRSKFIIGRDVHNCHPPESVNVVEQIVHAFRNGKKDVASFWINMKGQQLLIQYFPVRDEAGNYRGVVEVSQEITEIRQLQGEKRLLDWED